MEPRAKLRLERLDQYATPFVPANVKPVPNLQFSLDELNVIAQYETNVNDYIRTNLISWLTKGGVSDDAWTAFKSELSGRVGLTQVQQVYQAAYDRYTTENK